MLRPILSSESQEKILFFLLINSKCYATQLSKRFKSPLTPIQHSLGKLEQGGVLTSYYEGKIRCFEFNPHYPLLPELEILLKKAYTHLNANKKKLYYSPTFSIRAKRQRPSITLHAPSSQRTILGAWERLHHVQTLSFSAKSKSPYRHQGWNGIGRGRVEVKETSQETLIFQEKGSWTSEEGKEFDFTNAFRWTLQLEQESIVLEHLRFGAQHPVLLFSLVPIDAQTMESLDCHTCGQDAYFGQFRFDQHYLQLNWRVVGPNKNEEMDYLYT